jgi:hypothetical protein
MRGQTEFESNETMIVFGEGTEVNLPQLVVDFCSTE